MKYGIAVLAVAACLVWLHLDFSYSFEGAGLVGLLFMTLATTGIVSAIWFLRRRSRLARDLAMVALVSVFLSWLVSAPLSRRQLARSREAGDRIAAALASYRAREGRMPDHLSQLVPKDLDHLPDTALGLIRPVPFSYDPNAPDGQALSFPAPGWRICTREAESYWACDD